MNARAVRPCSNPSRAIAVFFALTATGRVRLYNWTNRAVELMKNGRRLMKVGAIGGVITALCCFTPVLVWLFTILGISALVGYLDYVLFPLLAVFMILWVIGFVRGSGGK